jgi:5-methylthioribose kinase
VSREAAVLDIEQPAELVEWLRRSGRIGAEEAPEVQLLRGGVSNRTVRVARPDGEAWVLKQALPKLRVAEDWYSSPERIHREAAGLRWLSDLLPAGSVPRFAWEDREEHVLAMSAVPEPHENLKELLLRGAEGGGLRWLEPLGELLATIHRRGRERREDLAHEFADAGFFHSLRAEPYYGFTARRLPAAADFLGALLEETGRCRVTLVHGDFSPKNVLVHAGRLILLDHEVIHFGDPAFDVGFSLAHLLSKAHHLTRDRAAFLEGARSYWRAYEAALGSTAWAPGLEERSVRHTLGCLLARVAGRSPLEYLDEVERVRQREAVLAIIGAPPGTVPGLVDAWETELGESDAGH